LTNNEYKKYPLSVLDIKKNRTVKGMHTGIQKLDALE